MGKVVEKKKKKGRPSLLDLQKRNIKQQQIQLQQNQKNLKQQNPNPNPNPPAHRRFTRRNPNPDGIIDDREEDGEDDIDDDDDAPSGRRRREKKLKLVLRLPNRAAENSASGSEGSGAEGENGETPIKRRKINAVGVGDGSGEKAERRTSTSKGANVHPEVPSNSGSTTPLPDKKLLVFILDRLQKKDTYGVFSEPVDANELPDYHEVIDHPMDFSTMRKKLSCGGYATLEQFEKDVLLICSNAMHYNAPDTIYFRQARSIHELAIKNFDNLRQDSEDNEPELKVVRRGRPPGKNTLKKLLGRPPANRAGSDFSDATLATPGDNRSNLTHDLSRRGTDLGDLSARNSHGSHNGEVYGWLADHKSERYDEFSGCMLKGISKFGKKPFVLDENRRNTYKQSLQLVSGHEPSVLATFNREKKQFMPIGLHVEHAYARSLARFAANLGPTAWKVASRKIERALPPGAKFGPGWVGENDIPQPPQPPVIQSLQRPLQPPASTPLPPAQTRTPSCSTAPQIPHPKGYKLLKHESPNNSAASEIPLTSTPTSTASSSVANRYSDSSDAHHGNKGKNFDTECSPPSKVGGGVQPRPPFQLHHNPPSNSPVNGFVPGIGFDLTQEGKMIRPRGSAPTNFSSEASTPTQLIDIVNRRASNSFHSMPASLSEAEVAKLLGTSNSVYSGGSGQGLGMQQSWRGLKMHSKLDSVPPDLNVRFQSPGSPATGGMVVDSQQPDLALQL